MHASACSGTCGTGSGVAIRGSKAAHPTMRPPEVTVHRIRPHFCHHMVRHASSCRVMQGFGAMGERTMHFNCGTFLEPSVRPISALLPASSSGSSEDSEERQEVHFFLAEHQHELCVE